MASRWIDLDGAAATKTLKVVSILPFYFGCNFSRSSFQLGGVWLKYGILSVWWCCIWMRCHQYLPTNLFDQCTSFPLATTIQRLWTFTGSASASPVQMMESSVGDLSWINCLSGATWDTRLGLWRFFLPFLLLITPCWSPSVCFLFHEVRPKSAEIFKRPGQPFFRCLVFWPFWIFWVKSMEYLERIWQGVEDAQTWAVQTVWIPGLRNHLSGPPLLHSHCLQGRRGEGETEKSGIKSIWKLLRWQISEHVAAWCYNQHALSETAWWRVKEPLTNSCQAWRLVCPSCEWYRWGGSWVGLWANGYADSIS